MVFAVGKNREEEDDTDIFRLCYPVFGTWRETDPCYFGHCHGRTPNGISTAISMPLLTRLLGHLNLNLGDIFGVKVR